MALEITRARAHAARIRRSPSGRSTRTRPIPRAYVEALLAEYFDDIVGEIKRYSDEGRSLYQFRRAEAVLPPFPARLRQSEVELSTATRSSSRSARAIAIPRAARSTSSSSSTARCTSFRSRRWTRAASRRADLPKWRARLGDGARCRPSSAPASAIRRTPINQPMA